MLGGGKFTKQNKRLPGTYINFISRGKSYVTNGSSGNSGNGDNNETNETNRTSARLGMAILGFLKLNDDSTNTTEPIEVE